MLYLDPAAQAQAVSGAHVVDALRAALNDGLDPEADSPRISSPLPGGEFLLMPATFRSYCGVKVLAVRPENPSRGLPAVQGLYTLFDTDTLRPLATLDAAELTLIRTPAVTALAAELLLEAKRTAGERGSVVAVVVGTGPQARRHAHLLCQRGVASQVIVLGRRPRLVDDMVAELQRAGADARAGDIGDLASADLIVTATSSANPLFDAGLVPSHAVVCAVGAHGHDRRELPGDLVRESDVVVEARAAAMRESGNLLLARPLPEWESIKPTNLAELIQGRLRLRSGRPAVYSGVGMAWQDLVVASTIFERATS